MNDLKRKLIGSKFDVRSDSGSRFGLNTDAVFR